MKNNKEISKMTVSEANKRIANIEDELAMLKKIVNAKSRAPMKLSYSAEELVDGITNGTIDELVVGDYLDITLYTEEVVRLIVIGKQHDKDKAGNSVDYTFGIRFVDMRVKMNDENTNKGGWRDCKMRNVYLERIAKLLPSVITDNIVPVQKNTTLGNGSKRIDTTTDKLFCFSEVEFYGKNDISYDGEGEQYEYFKKDENRNVPNYPWLRSPHYNYSSYFCFVGDSGCADYTDACYSEGVAFGFCLSSEN